MPRSEAEVRALFDAWAATYDRDVQHPHGPMEGYTSSLEAAAAMLPVEPGAQVLDLGIGTGRFAELFAAQGARLSGVDISQAMLDECAALHPDYLLTIGTFNPIPYDDGLFDAVITSFTFHEIHPQYRAEACREMARVLRPGGRVVLLDIVFASFAARNEAKQITGPYWDSSEDYALVVTLDEYLRAAGFTGIFWQQTAPCHWAAAGRKVGRDG